MGSAFDGNVAIYGEEVSVMHPVQKAIYLGIATVFLNWHGEI